MNSTTTISNSWRPFRTSLAIIIGLMVIGSLGGCASFFNKTPTNADELYDQGKRRLDGSDYGLAIKSYEILVTRFPFSNAARQGQLDLMYAYYKNDNRESCIDLADQFIRENPTHPRVDYAYYVKGLANFDPERNFLERWFRVDLSRRPPSNSRSSFQAFQQLLQRFPNSPYAADARQRMIFLRNRLATYEVFVASYYYNRGAYVAALNRARYAIENYDGAPAIREALEISRDSYNGLGMKDQADRTIAVLALNYPNQETKEKKRFLGLF